MDLHRTPLNGTERWSKPGRRADGTRRTAALEAGETEQDRIQEALSRLAGASAHEFNNLLTVIVGNASFLLSEIEDEAARRDLEAIVAACERGSGFTSKLLLMSARAWRECRTVDLGNLLRSMDLGEGAEGEVVVIADLPETPCRVVADPQHLEDVVTGLIANARDALPARGFVRIALNPVRLTGKGTSARPFSGEPTSEEWVHLEVSDNGVGMDPATAARATEPFFSTKPNPDGGGLGLSTALGVARQSGGTLQIESATGGGTRIHLWLPAAPEVRAHPEMRE